MSLQSKLYLTRVKGLIAFLLKQHGCTEGPVSIATRNKDPPTPLSQLPPTQVNETQRKSTRSKYFLASIWVVSYNRENIRFKAKCLSMMTQLEKMASCAQCSKSKLKHYFPFPKERYPTPKVILNHLSNLILISII